MRNVDKRLTIIYGDTPKEMTAKLLEAVDMKALIKKGTSARIGIKPNLVNATPPEKGATTHPEIVEAVILYLQASGFRDIVILEGSWVGANTQTAFRTLGYDKLAETYGVRLLDTKRDAFVQKSYNGITMEISKTALELDFLIDIPVLKGHCQTLVTGALKNLKGIISDREKRHFHTLGLHKPIACLNRIISADFSIVDGICGDLDFEEGGNPVQMNRIFGGTDPVLVDAYIAQTMGYRPEEIGYLKLSADYGVGSADLSGAEIVELNKDTGKVKASPSRIVKELSAYTAAEDACSACFANLIQALMRLKDEGGLARFGENKIAIGQGYRGKSLSCPGIGNCTREFASHVSGCPPHTPEILDYLRNY